MIVAHKLKLFSCPIKRLCPDYSTDLQLQVLLCCKRLPHDCISNCQCCSVATGYRTIDSLYPRSTTMIAPGTRAGGAPFESHNINNLRQLNYMNATLASRPGEKSQDMMTTVGHGPKTTSVQEQAGINTTFPGRTEYMLRYNTQRDTAKSSDFIINPKPNLHIFGRPLGKAHYEPGFTEYQTRYDWPDGERIVKLPWLRK